MYNKIFDFLVRYQILFKSQFGFRRGHNTTHATLDFLKTIENALQLNECAIGIFCDLSKAFDTLDHQILLKKLDHYGIRGKMLSWIKSYLSDRTQFVDLNGVLSKPEKMLVGVPQGSILGPLLFLIYVNDLPAALEKVTPVIYADDTNLIIKGKDLQALIRILNSELEILSDYFKANKLKLNVDKTKMVCFSRKGHTIDSNHITVTMDGTPIEREQYSKYLGITLDENLSWEYHCNTVANKMARNAGILNRIKNHLPTSSLCTLYNSLIFPHFSYGLEAWGACHQKFLKRIITIQKKAVRSISKSHWLSHTEPRMRKYNILKFADQHYLQSMSLTYNMLKGNSPDIYNLSSIQNGQRQLSLRSTTDRPEDLRMTTTHSLHAQKTFLSYIWQPWNDLQTDIKNASSRKSLKTQLKKSIINKYHTKVQCLNHRCTDRKYHQTNT